MRALRMLDAVANNIANMNTTGFKADRPIFQLHSPDAARGVDPDSSEGRLAAAYATLEGNQTDFTQGTLNQTDVRSDLALHGEGFFKLRDADGKTYVTRDGAFVLNEAGQLATRDGLTVQSAANGTIDLGTDLFTITSDGTIKVGEELRGQVAVVDLADKDGLSKAGSNRWLVDNPKDLTAVRSQVAQGHLEASNVHPVHALTELIAVSRYYEAFQSGLEASSKLDQELNSKVGRIDQ